jgi:nitroreductase
MKVSDAVGLRRSIKRFTDRPVTRAEVDALLDAAVRAPNHRLTQPWHFYVLGPESRRAYGLALGQRKARKLPDPAAAEAVRKRTADEYASIPCIVAVTIELNDDPEIREEDYGAAMMAVENLALLALEFDLGTHIRTGAIMDDPAAREAVGVPDGQRIVALVQLGEPAETPPSKPRIDATSRTEWRP